ncbi:hypothetical protein EWM64_g7671 [Hericium alpestre]|uniref:Amino acid permease/ SLC12A domain-containing protein n=1 Tax=Hericium alpestre TaxID=135208 RepID=A0A4Y9ZQ13_9AGAM|nr:hypothetical protein EWM64_g7671 [Hericium alpestre]
MQTSSKADDITIAEAGAPPVQGDEAELARMGYKQELKRDLSLMQNFGVSFSIISVITGIPSLFAYGLMTGGPSVMVWGWVVVSFFTMLVGLAMAEVCSAHPTSGGPYFWAAMLSRPQNAAFASWVTGWFNLLGQVAVTTGISFACANFISTACTLGTDFVPTAGKTIGIYAAVLSAQGAINTFGVRILKYLNNISVWWHAIGTVSVVIAILAAAPKHQSAKVVFASFVDGTGVDGVGWSQRASPAYVVVIGILMAQYTLTGFDATATSIATIGLYISYGEDYSFHTYYTMSSPQCPAIPIALRVIYADKFVRGPFHLGIFSFPVAIAAVTWIAFISIVFVLPELNPVNSQTLNYAIVAVGIVLTYSMGFWLLSARKWFTGPIKQIAAEEQGINITDPAAMAEKEDLEKMF